MASDEEDEYQLSENQIEEIREVWAKYDKEKKDFIPVEQVGSIMKNLGHNLNAEQLKEVQEVVDADGSGTVDWDEFLALMSQKYKDAEDEHIVREAFRIFDKKGHGWIDVADLKIILKTMDDQMTDEELDAIVDEVDDDKSGTVDFEEFMKLVTS